jgi:hypothetical protein
VCFRNSVMPGVVRFDSIISYVCAIIVAVLSIATSTRTLDKTRKVLAGTCTSKVDHKLDSEGQGEP